MKRKNRSSSYDIQVEIFNKVFRSAQYCWWYALYSDDYSDWSKEQMMEYNKKVHDADERYARRTSGDNGKYRKELKRILGIDIDQWTNKVSYRTKMKMYGQKIKCGKTEDVLYQINNAVNEAIFLAVITLYKEYGKTAEEIEKVFKGFLEVAEYYTIGMEDKHVVKYFSELEGIPIIED